MLQDDSCRVEWFEAFAKGFEGLWLDYVLKGCVEIALSGGINVVIHVRYGAGYFILEFERWYVS